MSAAYPVEYNSGISDVVVKWGAKEPFIGVKQKTFFKDPKGEKIERVYVSSVAKHNHPPIGKIISRSNGENFKEKELPVFVDQVSDCIRVFSYTIFACTWGRFTYEINDQQEENTDSSGIKVRVKQLFEKISSQSKDSKNFEAELDVIVPNDSSQEGCAVKTNNGPLEMKREKWFGWQSEVSGEEIRTMRSELKARAKIEKELDMVLLQHLLACSRV